MKKKRARQKVFLYGQNLKPEDILIYLPTAFRQKLTKRQANYLKQAFFKTVLAYQKKEEQDYLNKMLV
ncbi:MAG: hypothetical protein K9L86_00975 [Candidatus Omnitrophica bacterium]|nr:hypothetical protein [Candidatus Omnitrophota bacterium]